MLLVEIIIANVEKRQQKTKIVKVNNLGFIQKVVIKTRFIYHNSQCHQTGVKGKFVELIIPHNVK